MAEKLADLAQPPKAGNLTPDSFLEAYREMREAKRAQSEAGTAVARVGKKLKALGADARAFKLFETLMALDIDEAQTVLTAAVKYAGWADHPLQLELFADMQFESASPKAKVEFKEFEVEDEGYVAGFKGMKASDNPYAADKADDPSHVIWLRGWHKGQAALAHKSFGGKPEGEVSAPRRGRPRRSISAIDPSETTH